jgi:hypothetical protein
MELIINGRNKEFWQSVRESASFARHREDLFALWRCDGDSKPITELKYSDYMLFKTTGDRSAYESHYFARRRALACSSLLALIYPEEERYLTHLQNVIFAICNEYSWCLPAHQNTQGGLDKMNSTILDLFACETGFALSEIHTMLGDRLDPLIKERTVYEINRRIVTPFTSVDNYGSWENWNTNWTAVCMGSVACTLMLMHPELVDDKMIARFIASIEKYVSGLGNDGICLEGCGYWYYGFGFFTIFADMLRRFTDGKTDLFKSDKICRVAQFIQNTQLSDGCAVSFADSGSIFSYHTGLVHYLKSEYPDKINVPNPKYATISNDSCARFCLLLRSFIWYNAEYCDESTPTNSYTETYAEVSQWLIKRTPYYGFAAKAGHNAEPHNHNDVGAFIFAKGGKQILVDTGAGRYTRQYFTKDTRYTIIENSSRSHNVPVIDGKYQPEGFQYRAVDVKYEPGTFSMNLAPAYGNPEIERIDRRFEISEDSVTLRDSFTYTGQHTICDRLVSFIKPDVSNAGIVKLEDTVIYYDPSLCTCRISSEPTTRDPELLCYMIDFELKDGVKEFSCKIK